MRTDPGVLAALCEKTDNDIRACINTLQVGAGRHQVGWGGVGSQPPLIPPPVSSFCTVGASGS